MLPDGSPRPLPSHPSAWRNHPSHLATLEAGNRGKVPLAEHLPPVGSACPFDLKFGPDLTHVIRRFCAKVRGGGSGDLPRTALRRAHSARQHKSLVPVGRSATLVPFPLALRSSPMPAHPPRCLRRPTPRPSRERHPPHALFAPTSRRSRRDLPRPRTLSPRRDPAHPPHQASHRRRSRPHYPRQHPDRHPTTTSPRSP